jgi:hypothetical protein
MRSSSGGSASGATDGETAAGGRRMSPRVCYLLCEGPTDRPKLISPLSIRKLKPQSGLLHTHALNVIGAPSRP